MDLPHHLGREPTWAFPRQAPADAGDLDEKPDYPEQKTEDLGAQDQDNTTDSSTTSPPKETKRKYYPPRMCRICFESVPPTYHYVSEHLPDMLKFSPSVTYESDDPEFGRLIKPCLCKGSSRYVHEGCLKTWRHADPDYSKRNFWQCPTCGFRYRLDRMAWAGWISAQSTQIFLTLSILLLTMFALGFIADPIINLYVDPYDTILTSNYWEGESIVPKDRPAASWFEHFVKGLASLGLLSFVKVLFTLSPWQWWNVRSSGLLGGGRRATTGRDRAASISWIVVVVGILTFLWTVFKGVKAFSRQVLERASSRVLDVHLPEDDEEFEEEESSKKDE